MKKYIIVQSVLPVSLIKHSGDKDYATIDRILTVCASLTNLSPSSYMASGLRSALGLSSTIDPQVCIQKNLKYGK